MNFLRRPHYPSEHSLTWSLSLVIPKPSARSLSLAPLILALICAFALPVPLRAFPVLEPVPCYSQALSPSPEPVPSAIDSGFDLRRRTPSPHSLSHRFPEHSGTPASVDPWCTADRCRHTGSTGRTSAQQSSYPIQRRRGRLCSTPMGGRPGGL